MEALRIGRRTALVGLLAVAVIGLIAYTVFWSLGACRPLDRLLGRSPCVASLTLEGVDLLSDRPLSPPEAGDAASLFASIMTADGWRPGMVRVDLQAGREVGRFPLPAGHAPVTLRHS